MPNTSKNSVLIVVDMQNDFAEGGALPVPGGLDLVPEINRLIEAHDVVVFTHDWHPPHHRSFASQHPGREPFSLVDMHYGPQVLWPDHCVQGTHGADFIPGLDRLKARAVIRKGLDPHHDSYSGFADAGGATTGLAGLLEHLSQSRSVTLCGLALDYCVKATALDARKASFTTEVVLGACRPIDLGGSLDAAMQEMQQAGVRIIGG